LVAKILKKRLLGHAEVALKDKKIAEAVFLITKNQKTRHIKRWFPYSSLPSFLLVLKGTFALIKLVCFLSAVDVHGPDVKFP
jgi:hypothetical protein